MLGCSVHLEIRYNFFLTAWVCQAFLLFIQSVQLSFHRIWASLPIKFNMFQQLTRLSRCYWYFLTFSMGRKLVLKTLTRITQENSLLSILRLVTLLISHTILVNYISCRWISRSFNMHIFPARDEVFAKNPFKGILNFGPL